MDCRGANRNAVDQERAGVVEQAFAFEDFQDAVWQLDLTEDGRRRGRVRRRNDSAERNRGSPRHVRQQPVDEHRHCRGSEADRDEHQRRDRQPVIPEVAHRGVIRGIHQHGRHEQRQRQIGLQCPGLA